MAKTTKSTKRPTTAKQKKGGLFSKINFRSRRTQFISVILLIAVMGGSWFTYRSFAASSGISIFATNATTNGQRIVEKRTNSGKNDVSVVSINSRQNIIWYTGQSTVKGNVYEVCALASGLTSTSKYGLHLQGASSASLGYNIIGAQPMNYRRDCRNFVATSSVQNAWVRVDGEGTPTATRVSSMDFRLVRANSYPEPGPVTTNPTK
jgi:hypothetical protein